MLEQALDAFDRTMTVWTRDVAPFEWVRSMGDQGVAMMMLADRTDNRKLARLALDQITLARANMKAAGNAKLEEFFAARIPMAQTVAARLEAN